MPCEVLPRTVNSTHIAVELEIKKAENRTMYEGRLEQEKNLELLEGFGVEGEKHYGKTHHQGDRKDPLRDYDEKYSPKIFQKDIQYSDFGYRTLPRVFSTLGDFGVIQEIELNTDDLRVTSESRLKQNHNSKRKDTTNAGSKTRHEKVGLLGDSQPEIIRPRPGGSAFHSAQSISGSVQYHNDSAECNLGEQRSERKDDCVLEQVTGKLALLSNATQRSSFTAMNALPETLSDSRRFYSLPRKLSVPVVNHRSTFNINGMKKRNSIPSSPNYSVRSFVLDDDDTNDQWEKLVARARSFQMLSTKAPVKMMNSKEEKTDSGNMRKASTSCRREGVDTVSSGNERNSEVIERKENEDSVEITQQTTSQEQQTLSAKLKEDDIRSPDEIKAEEHSSIALTEKEVLKSGRVDLTVKRSLINPTKTKPDTKPQVNRNSRRYSLATVRPTPEPGERISGYSTHGALEYARILLGKIQTEGKSKSKKERLDDMSKALKMVLEELNRIEVPDRDLVSLFISLRAKIVNLKDELKDEEKVVKNDKETEQITTVLSKTFPSRVRNTLESDATPAHLRRRFSWC